MSKSDVLYLAIFEYFLWDMAIAKTVYRVRIRETVPVDKLSSYFGIFIINEQNIARHATVTEQVRGFEKISSCLSLCLSPNDTSIREKYVAELWIVILFWKLIRLEIRRRTFESRHLNKCL